MTRKLTIGLALLTTMLLSPCVTAQEEQAASFIYATYFYCDTDKQGRVDEITKWVYKPVYDKAVEDGDLTAWGWLAHHTGSKWRRVNYMIAPSIEQLLDAQVKIGDELDENAPAAGRVFAEACRSHVDYIWRNVDGVGSQNLGGNRGDAAFSVYFVCDMSKEERADEIVKKTLGPIYDKHMGDDGFTSWGWLQHIVGGNIRRVLTLTAKDHKTLLKTRAAIFEEISDGKAERAADEFTEICGSHNDYMWNLQIETP